MKKLLRWLLVPLVCATCFAQSNGVQNYSSATLTASTQLVAAPSGTGVQIHILTFTIQIVQGSSAVSWGLVSGTGSACATGQALVTPAYIGVASVPQSISQNYGPGTTINLPANTALCLNLSGAPTGAVVNVTYTIN
jgi:hypothetical protein